ncbi:hypothetical protein GCM10022254_22590 [Actinomadura meridiana]|uniref:Histidine kinase/HSP90-like ATPase domain-containing protein n=1 Tax=Actinomadura meridiana TaxID=559626 RepID=A0ABP8BYM3_9ACTN
MPATTLTPGTPPTLVLEFTKQAPRLARQFLAERFAEWGLEDDYVGRLVISELTTNAYKHGAGPIIVRVFLDDHDGRPVLEVWDTAETRPKIQPENTAATSGRGLQLLADFAAEWGVRPLNEGGKITWAKLH